MTAGQPERRRDLRADAAVPVFLENATGVTRDMSVSGVFFWTDMLQVTSALGKSISFAVAISRPGGKITIRCRGVVVRTEPRGNDVGVAVRITESAEVLV
jgi:hypothetical protein